MKGISKLLALSLCVTPLLSVAADVEDVIEGGADRLQINQQGQQSVDEISEATDDLLQTYQSHVKIVDGLEIYNRLLQQQVDGQLEEKAKLENSIANATIIERQIMPLLLRMIDGLETFIDIDMPFLLEERHQRVTRLRRILASPEYTIAEKSRRVFEAYEVEDDYGTTLETYKGTLQRGEQSFDVDFLRIGRVGLLYRTLGQDGYGYWDQQNRDWVTVESSHIQRNINKGLKMAHQEMAPDLLSIPIAPATGQE